MNKQTLSDLVQQLSNQLIRRRLTISTAESCTGGLIAKLFTDLPGSSDWYTGSLITYNNDIKTKLLNVDQILLNSSGAVSRPVVESMSESVLAKCSSTISIATSGIAGPSGGTKEKPVGMVWVSWSGKFYSTQSECFYFEGDRESIREQAAIAAISGCTKFIVKNA